MIPDALRSELEASRSEFHALLDSVSPQDWQQRSANRGWTNGQLLFHIALGFFLTVPLVWLMRVFAATPRGASRAFAAVLNAGTPLFNWINGLGPRAGARILRGPRLGRMFDRVHRLLLKQLDSMGPDDWSRGMHYPVRWDPERFPDFMTFEQLFRYPTAHMRHHRAQLQRAPTTIHQPPSLLC